MSSLKLYEHLAAGLPVVSILPPVHRVDDERVYVCRRADWAAGLSRAVEMGRADEGRRLRFIEDVIWQQRMRPVVDVAAGLTATPM